MIKPTEQDLDRKVIYTSLHGEKEEGVLVGFNDSYAFVRYAGTGPQATSFDDLDWLE